MKCASCDEIFLIRTDPQNATYEMVKGLRKMRNREEPNKIETGPTSSFSKLEQINEASKEDIIVQKLIDKNSVTQKDDYKLNSKLRQANRSVRHQEHNNMKEAASLGLAAPLLPETEEDKVKAAESFNKSNSVVRNDRVKRLMKDPFMSGLKKSSIDVVVISKRKKKRKTCID